MQKKLDNFSGRHFPNKTKLSAKNNNNNNNKAWTSSACN